MDALKTLEARISAIEEKLGLDNYNWNWCCADKAFYTEASTREGIFVFHHKRFKMCPFCGESL